MSVCSITHEFFLYNDDKCWYVFLLRSDKYSAILLYILRPYECLTTYLTNYYSALISFASAELVENSLVSSGNVYTIIIIIMICNVLVKHILHEQVPLYTLKTFSRQGVHVWTTAYL